MLVDLEWVWGGKGGAGWVEDAPGAGRQPKPLSASSRRHNQRHLRSVPGYKAGFPSKGSFNLVKRQISFRPQSGVVGAPWWTRSKVCGKQARLPRPHSQTHLFRLQVSWCPDSGIHSLYEQYLGRPPGGLPGCLPWGSRVLTETADGTPGSPRAPPLPPRAPPRPHLHARRLLQGQAHRVAAVRAQQRAERAHAAPAAATEELGHAVAVLRAAPAARVLRLGGARAPRSWARSPRARHSLPLLGVAGAGGALAGNRNRTAGRGRGWDGSRQRAMAGGGVGAGDRGRIFPS